MICYNITRQVLLFKFFLKLFRNATVNEMCPQVRLQTIEELIMLPSVVLEVLRHGLVDLIDRVYRAHK